MYAKSIPYHGMIDEKHCTIIFDIKAEPAQRGSGSLYNISSEKPFTHEVKTAFEQGIHNALLNGIEYGLVHSSLSGDIFVHINFIL